MDIVVQVIQLGYGLKEFIKWEKGGLYKMGVYAYSLTRT